MLRRLFFRGTINEGWKNWMIAIVLVVMSLGHIQQANAQNIVVDALRNPNEVVGTRYDNLTLDPNKSIKENWIKIDDFLHVHSENIYTDFIVVRGHYVGNHNNSYDFPIGRIRVKDNEVNRSAKKQIIDILTKLYSHSLDRKFQVSYKKYVSVKVGNSYFYSLLSSSLLYKKIHYKVAEEVFFLRRKTPIIKINTPINPSTQWLMMMGDLIKNNI